MSKANYDVESQLQKQIEDAQLSLSSTLEALAHEAQPSVQIEYAKQSVAHKFESFKTECKATVAAAREGDKEALKRVAAGAGVVAGAGALVGLCVKRQTRKCKQRRQWRRFTRQLRKTTPPGTVDFTVQHSD